MGLFWDLPFLKFHRELMPHSLFALVLRFCLFASIFLHPFENFEFWYNPCTNGMHPHKE